MTDAYHLKAIETRIWDVPQLYLRPVWAHGDTLQEAQPVPFGTPHFGLTNIAIHISIDCLSGCLVAYLVAAPIYELGLNEHNATNREFRATATALATLQRQIGAREPTIGEKCQAWVAAFDMPGMLLPRSPGDECGRFRLCRNVRSAVDHYLAEWENRAREESVPIAMQVEAMTEVAVEGLR